MANSFAVLLDRDGTLIEDRHYLSDPAGVSLLPGVGEGLARLAAAGWDLFLVSNQSGIGRGYFTEEAVLACQRRLEELLAPFGVVLKDAVWCPHAPETVCRCRKPAPGLFETLAARHGLAPQRCVMIGDKVDDLGFAAAAGLCAGVLVLSGKGRGHARQAGLPIPDAGVLEAEGTPRKVVAVDFKAAADWVINFGVCVS